MVVNPVPTMSTAKIKTIREVQEEYERLGEMSVHAGFRNAVEAMLENGFEGSFANDCYSDALVLTQKMLERTDHNLRVLSGGEADAFFKLLKTPLRACLERVRANNGTVRIIVVHEGAEEMPSPGFLSELAKEFNGVLEVVSACSQTQVSHFMVADDNMLRVEEKHGKLTLDSPEDAIRAKVFFDEKPVASGYIDIFDKVWTNFLSRA